MERPNNPNINKPKDLEKSPREIAFRNETNEKIKKLLETNTDLRGVARLLGAEKYLKTYGNSSYFNAKAFIDDQVKAQTFLKMPEEFLKISEVILPPDSKEIITGSGKGIEPKEFILRSQFLIELLSEMKLSYKTIEGENTPNMMRELSYYAFIILEIKKLILVNNEEGNATFIIHSFEGSFEEAKKYLQMTKDELKGLPSDIISELIYPGNKEDWKMRLRDILENGVKEKVEILKTEKSEKKEKQKFDYNNQEHLRELLKDSPVDLNICRCDEFVKTTFGKYSQFGKRGGAALLRNFGAKKEDTENMIRLLNFAGIEREQKKPECDCSDPKQLQEIFKDSLINLKRCGIYDFSGATFGADSKFEKRNGGTMLKNFGTKKVDTENMIELLNFAGIEREKFDYSNPKHLQEIFKDSPIHLKTCRYDEFKKAIFGENSRFKKRSGKALLRNFGTKKEDTENMIRLLNFAGIEREQKKPECDYSDPKQLQEIFKDLPIDLKTCRYDEFKKVIFGVNSRFEKRSGITLLTNFGTKKEGTENMIKLLNFAGIEREKFSYSNPKHLEAFFKNSPIDLKNCGVDKFLSTTFMADSKFEKRNGGTMLKNFGTKKEDTENMIKLLNFAGIEREKFDYSNPKHLQELFKDSPIDLKICGSNKFRKTIFGADSKFEKRRGDALLQNFGTKKGNAENMINLINFVFPEIKRKK